MDSGDRQAVDSLRVRYDALRESGISKNVNVVALRLGTEVKQWTIHALKIDEDLEKSTIHVLSWSDQVWQNSNTCVNGISAAA